MSHALSIWILCALALLHPSAYADKFENVYLSFDLPDGWGCQQEGTEFVCRPIKGQARKEAIIIMTAKQVGPQDTLSAYRSHLNQQPATGKIIQPATQIVVNGIVWIDALQLGSEVKNYFTRYFSTVNNGIAVLFTMSVHQNYYDKYSGTLTFALHTIKIKQFKL